MSRESQQPCWRHCRGSLDNPMSASWPFWSLTASSTCPRFICSRILVLVFLQGHKWNEHISCEETYLFCWFFFLTKFWWIMVFTRPSATSSALTGCPEVESLWQMKVCFEKKLQPNLPWEDTYPFITVNKSDFFQGPSKQMLPLLFHFCCFDYFSYCQHKELPWSLFRCFPCLIGSG